MTAHRKRAAQGRRLAATIVLAALACALEPTPGRAPSVAPTVPSGLSDDLACLALNVYWEARSESPNGQMAVAKVTLNRVRSDDFPDTVCGVVTQGAERRTGCQFSWQCDGRDDTPRDQGAWAEARSVALRSLYADTPDPTDGALFYHATYVTPKWVRLMAPVRRIGRHVFYRPRLTG